MQGVSITCWGSEWVSSALLDIRAPVLRITKVLAVVRLVVPRPSE